VCGRSLIGELISIGLIGFMATKHAMEGNKPSYLINQWICCCGSLPWGVRWLPFRAESHIFFFFLEVKNIKRFLIYYLLGSNI
jgi:hypothetical protein